MITETIETTISFTQDPEFPAVLNGGMGIFLVTEDEDLDTEPTRKKIGEIHCTAYDLSKIDSYSDWLDIVDGQGGDFGTLIATYIQYLTAQGAEFEDLGSCLTLDWMKIQKNYRHKGYGQEALQQFADYAERLGFDQVLLHPAPFESLRKTETREQKIEQLRRFYARAGFTVIPTERDAEVCMQKYVYEFV